MAAAEHVSVPVDYYRLLQVPRVSRPDAIKKAYEQHMRQQPATAYSADTLFARAVLLKAAAESLTDPDLRRSYDAKLAAGHTALRVSQQDLPGALVVLQEIGEYQLVLDLGSRWLELNGNQPDAGDVAAAVALAYCDRAGERLAAPDVAATAAASAAGGVGGGGAGAALVAGSGAVLPACDDLDAALARLRRYGMAKQLQAQIVGALRDLAPDYAVELAALPLGPDTAARRAKGVTLMRGVLRAAAAATEAARGGGGDAATVALLQSECLGEGDDEARSAWGHARRMLQRGRDVLTCSEQVSLLPDALAGSGPVPHPDVMYDGALALIVDGFRTGAPHCVHRASALLAALERRAAAATALAREQQDLAAAAAVRRAQYAGSGGGGAAAAEPAASGVHRYGEDGAGSAAAARTAAPAAAGGGVTLERAVCAVLLGDFDAAVELLGLGRDAGRGSVVEAAEGEDGGAAAGDSEGQQEAAQLKAFVLSNSPAGERDLRPGLCALAARWLEGVALASFRDTAGQPVAPLERDWFARPRVAAYLQVRRVSRAEQVLAAAHFLCNLLPTSAKLASELAARAAVILAAVAARAQRIATVLAGAALAVAAAATNKKKRPARDVSAIGAAPAADRRAGAGGKDAGDMGPLPRPARSAAAPAAAAPAAFAAATVGGEPSGVLAPSPGPDVEPPASPSRGAGAAMFGGGPFGHPYGKLISDRGAAAGARSDRDRLPGAAASAAGRAALGAAATGAAAVAVAAAAAATSTTAPLTRALPRQHEEQAQPQEQAQGTDVAQDLRRRFAASASADAGLLAAPDSRAGHHDPHAPDGEDDDDDHAEVDVEDMLAGSPAAGAASEADLRAHLAGLEAAMWDSEEPGEGDRRRQVLMWIAGAVVFIVAFLLVGLRRPSSANSRLVVAAPAAASFAACSLPSAALRLRAAA